LRGLRQRNLDMDVAVIDVDESILDGNLCAERLISDRIKVVVVLLRTQAIASR
jgi:hypothetical protein